MSDIENSNEIQFVIDAIARTGKPYSIRNNELNTRCGFCGDSVKNAFHKHFYINLSAPHPCFCQRCGFRSGMITSEVLEALNAAERDASVYVRQLEKKARSSRKERRRPPSMITDGQRMIIPLPDRTNEEDRNTIEFLEKRLQSPISEKEIERYRIITCGLYGFLQLNDISELTIHQREADRLNESCIGFLSSDESYIIFRTMDDEYVKNGGRRYTNYRIHNSWEGSKSFSSRSDINLLAPEYKVVCAEGIIDLIQIEKTYYNENRWSDSFIGVATCGSTHETVLRQLLVDGIINQSLDLYIDNDTSGAVDKKLLAAAKRIPSVSPFFQTNSFEMKVYRNSYPGSKDFGIPSKFHKRTSMRI